MQRPLSIEARRADRRALALYLGEPTMRPIILGLGHPCDHVVITRPFLPKTTKPRNLQGRCQSWKFSKCAPGIRTRDLRIKNSRTWVRGCPALSGLVSISGVIPAILGQHFEPCPGWSGVVWLGSLANRYHWAVLQPWPPTAVLSAQEPARRAASVCPV